MIKVYYNKYMRNYGKDIVRRRNYDFNTRLLIGFLFVMFVVGIIISLKMGWNIEL